MPDGDNQRTGTSEQIEVPSCIESLANSACQLRQLADQASQFYAKILFSYGYTSGRTCTRIPSNRDLSGPHNSTGMSLKTGHRKLNQDRSTDLERLANDANVLESLTWSVRLIPLLNELCTFIERCLATVESTIRRIIYYINLASQKDPKESQQDPAIYEDHQLTSDVQIDAIFVALMDLMFALISLDKTIENHTNLAQDLDVSHDLLGKLASNSNSTDTISGLLANNPDLSGRNVPELFETVDNIVTTIGAAGTKTDAAIFRQCIDRVQYLNLLLSKERTLTGYKLFREIFEEFLISYSDYLIDLSRQNPVRSKIESISAMTFASISIRSNLIPTTSMITMTRRIFGLASLSILFSSIFNQVGNNKSVFRAINQVIQKTKASNIVLLDNSNSHLNLAEFLLIHMPKSSIETKTFDLLLRQVNSFNVINSQSEVERLTALTTSWITKLKNEVLDYEYMQLSDWPKRQLLLLDQSLSIASEIATIVRCISLVQQRTESSENRDSLLALYRLSILLKSIQTNLNKYESFISTILVRVEHSVRAQWRQLFKDFQKRQVSMKYSERKMELSSAIKLSSVVACAELLSCQQGRIIQSICLSMLLPMLSSNELRNLNALLDLMRFEFIENLELFTNCDHLYWHTLTIGSYYSFVLSNLNGAISEVKLLHVALSDIKHLLEVSHRPSWSQVDIEWLIEQSDKFTQKLSSELVDQFKDDYLDRICQELEIDLRLQTHKDVYLNYNPDATLIDRHLYNFRHIFSRDPNQPTTFQIFEHRLNLNLYIEQHLNKICYDLAALAPHDWPTYDNMMNFARHKYGLKFVNMQLPVQAVDYGLDLLDITRNLTSFASRYYYDMTNHLFIEKCSSNRLSVASSIHSSVSTFAPQNTNQLLNIVQSDHIVQSIQTHGFGTLDSAVNCTYLALKRLVNVFSRQLSDAKLKAMLQKEYQQVSFDTGTGRTSKRTISFIKASRMAKKFRLNVSIVSDQNELTAINNHSHTVDLDSMRQTITQVGNLLAFVRLIKSGALKSVSKSVDYVPDLSNLSSLRLSKLAENEFSDYESFSTLLDATKNFDQCLDDFDENFSPKTNYLKIIINQFSSLLSKGARKNEDENESTFSEKEEAIQDGKAHPSAESYDPKSRSGHLRLFFLVIPALTINYIDHLINCKERASSRSSSARFGALLCDDGFAIGIAFFLAVLGQVDDYIRLAWFDEARSKLQADIDDVGRRLADPRYDSSLKQTSSMTLRRLKKLISEHNSLDHALTCALLLFENF